MSWVEDPFEFPPVSSLSMTVPTVPYTPQSAWCRPGRITIYRGSGVPIRFIQNGTPIEVDPVNYEARLGLEGTASPIRFSTGNGRLTYLGGGILSVNPTSEETESLSATGVIVIELWRIDADDNKTVVGKSVVSISASINP